MLFDAIFDLSPILLIEKPLPSSTFFLALSLRLVLIKDGEFKGTCASQNPYLGSGEKECSYCGKTVSPGSDCKKD